MILRPSSSFHERELYQWRTYEPGTLALMDKVLRPGDTMIDVGSSMGLMALHGSKLVGDAGTVVALEPHPDVFQQLNENLKLNHCKNVRALQVAAGPKVSDETIYHAPTANVGGASLVQSKGPYTAAGIVHVEKLDTLVAEFQSIRFMKIDVEGFEASVLAGASDTLAKQPIICMEVSASMSSNPLASHDMVMATGNYAAFRFKMSKARVCPLVPVLSRERLNRQVNDNIVYVPHRIRSALPQTLFA
jgi:FkbM family methyltransferase